MEELSFVRRSVHVILRLCATQSARGLRHFICTCVAVFSFHSDRKTVLTTECRCEACSFKKENAGNANQRRLSSYHGTYYVALRRSPHTT